MGEDNSFDIFDQVFQDFLISNPGKNCYIINPYYCEEGCRVIHSYSGYGQLHTNFKHICVRERLTEMNRLPLQFLVPHIYGSDIDFVAIKDFILEYLSSYPKFSAKHNSKKFYSVKTTKLAINYMQSHKKVLQQRSDNLKIE